MNGLRFKVGDLVKAVVSFHDRFGSVGSIKLVKFLPRGTLTSDGSRLSVDCEYVVTWIDGEDTVAADWQLQPIKPTAEPVSLTRSEEVSV